MLLGNEEEPETKEKCRFNRKFVFVLIKATVEVL